MWLKLKILLGYVILLLLLVLTIHIFRKEQTRRNSLRQDEHELACIRHLAGETYAGLLGLATYGETASVWDESDLGLYHTKKDSVCNMLQTLKRYVKSPEQQSRIDSLCLLLERKELLLDTVMDTFGRLRKTGEIVNSKIPAIVSHIQQADVLPAVKKKEEETPKKGFWSFIRPGRRRSAYLQQKEQLERQRQSIGKHQGTTSVTSMLHSLDREVTDMQKAERERLLEQMDLLYSNNTDLNHRLHRIVRDFETDAGIRLDERYRQFISTRDRSFHTVSLLAVLISLLTVLLYLIIHRDLNRINQYQRQLEASNRENTELLQSRKRMMLTIAHDLRAPLATIKGCAELLPGEEKKSRKDEYAENILHSSDYMIGLVNTLIGFYLLDTGRNKPILSIFRLETLFSETARNYGSLAKKKKLRLTTAFSGLDVVVSGDRSQLQQILNNLLSNAIKYTPEHKKINVSLSAIYKEGCRFLVLNVEDEGIGIAEKDIKHIFTKFYNNKNHPGCQSNGIGLSLTKELVTLHHGIIEVNSEPGKGSVFTVEIPIDREVYSEREIAESSPLKVQEEETDTFIPDEKPCILFIDDNKDLRELIQHIFSKKYQIFIAENALQGLELLKNTPVDIIICDIMMPQMNGLEFCRQIKGDIQTNHIPIIMLTAKNATDDQIECYKAGAESYIAKPFEMKILQARIDNLLQSREQSRQSFRSKMEINISNLNYQTSDEEFLNNAMQCVERHIQESEFDTVQMANELHISRSTLSRKCKVISGCTPLEFIRNIKLKYACALLKKKTISISEVAYATGFSSPKYFTKCFKEEFGMTPTEYQSQ